MHKKTVHSDVSEFKCNLCPKQFKVNTNLNLHKMRVHSDARNFKCDICSKTFKVNHALSKHKKAVHSDVKKDKNENKCKKCDKVFLNSKCFKSHISQFHGKLQEN